MSQPRTAEDSTSNAALDGLDGNETVEVPTPDSDITLLGTVEPSAKSFKNSGILCTDQRLDPASADRMKRVSLVSKTGLFTARAVTESASS